MAVFIVSYEIVTENSEILLRSEIETFIKREYHRHNKINKKLCFVETFHTNKARDIRDEIANVFYKAKIDYNDYSADIFMFVYRVKKNWATLKESSLADWLDNSDLS